MHAESRSALRVYETCRQRQDVCVCVPFRRMRRVYNGAICDVRHNDTFITADKVYTYEFACVDGRCVNLCTRPSYANTNTVGPNGCLGCSLAN